MISEREQLKLMQKCRRYFGVSIRRNRSLGDCSAQADTEQEIVEINPTFAATTRSHFISCLLHECCHIWATREGYYKVFHKMQSEETMTVRELRIFLRTAWKAERFIEKTAQEAMSILFPGENLVYWWSYGRLKGREKSKDWFDEVYLASYRKAYRKKLLRSIDRQKRQEKRNERQDVQATS